MKRFVCKQAKTFINSLYCFGTCGRDLLTLVWRTVNSFNINIYHQDLSNRYISNMIGIEGKSHHDDILKGQNEHVIYGTNIDLTEDDLDSYSSNSQ